MTFTALERDVLSLHVWLRRCVLPSMFVLIGILVLMRWSTRDGASLDHLATIVGFFVFYFVLIRGGHTIMIRSLHVEMKTKYTEPYAERLARAGDLRRANVGFRLARIKRELIDAGVIENPSGTTHDWD